MADGKNTEHAGIVKDAHSEELQFYEKEMPDIGDIVKVKVAQVNETSAYVHLLEYNQIEGMIPFSEMTRRRIRSIAKHVRVGGLGIAQVIRCDKAKGYIDLSKKQVTAEEAQACEERYAKARSVQSIMRHAAAVSGMRLHEVLAKVSWPLYKHFGHAYDALKYSLTTPDFVYGKLNISDNLKQNLISIVQQKLKPQMLRFRVDINVTCFEEDGIDAIKDTLRAGQAEGNVDPPMEIHISINSPPAYFIRTQTENREMGIKKLRDIVETMRLAMLDRGGSVEVVQAPRIVGDDGEDIRAEDIGVGVKFQTNQQSESEDED